MLYTNSYAQESTISATPTETVTPTLKEMDSNIINELKDRIASRVAQLKLVERRGIIGTVTDVSDTQITIADIQQNTRFIDVDEITKFSSPSAEDAFGISDISKGSKIGALGLYNKQSRRLLARFVDVLVLPKSVSGVISNKDEENFTITVNTPDNKKIILDIEKTTKTSSYTKSEGLTKSGFSKIKGDERIIVMGFTDLEDKNRLVASRILVFPDLPQNQETGTNTESSAEENKITPTGSEKENPIKQ